MKLLEKRLAALTPELLQNLRRGIEKESLRVRPDGTLADTPHPAGLGSALTHPHITTDFSESQLELITGVHASAEACLAELIAIHQVVYRQLGDELLWCASMPCKLPDEDEIPLGRYGNVQSRPAQDRLSPGPLVSLRPAHADDFGHPLQLLAARGGVAGAAGDRRRPWPRRDLPGRRLFFPDPQLSPPFVAAAPAAGRLARDLRHVSRRPAASPERVGDRNLHRALRDVAADGRARLPERRAGLARRSASIASTATPPRSTAP